MPVYCFVCPVCGHRKEVLRQIADRNDPLDCDSCFETVDLRRDLQAERIGSTDLPYDKPVLSDAMGCHPDQVPEFRRLHPNLEVNGEGQVVCRSHREHRRAMKQLGYYDRKGFN